MDFAAINNRGTRIQVVYDGLPTSGHKTNVHWTPHRFSLDVGSASQIDVIGRRLARRLLPHVAFCDKRSLVTLLNTSVDLHLSFRCLTLRVFLAIGDV